MTLPIVIQIAREVGVTFVNFDKKWLQPKESRARRTCQKLLKKHGPSHLRLIFTLMDTEINEHAWNADCIKAVSMLLLNRSDLVAKRGFVSAIGAIDLMDLREVARRNAAGAAGVRIGLFHLLAGRVEGMLEERDVA